MNVRTLILIALLAVSIAACRKEQPAADTAGPATAGSEVPKTAATPGTATVGAPLPPYKAQTLDGKEFDFASTKGSVVLLNIWATWCGPCRYEIPELIKLHETYRPRGFQVIGASVDGGESVKDVAAMVKERNINYPVILDPDGKIADLFETNVIPTSALIDKEGKVVWTRVGTVEADEKELIDAIEKALKGV